MSDRVPRNEFGRFAPDVRGVELDVGKPNRRDRLLLRRHDALEAGITGRVDARLHRHHGRKRQVDDLELVVPELALDAYGVALDAHAHRGARARPVQKTGDEPTHLRVIVVVCLEAR